jgi:hypothetical protein
LGEKKRQFKRLRRELLSATIPVFEASLPEYAGFRNNRIQPEESVEKAGFHNIRVKPQESLNENTLTQTA